MSNDVYLKATELKQLLENDERIISLNESEKRMNEDEEVMVLAYKKDMAAVKYSDALNHYSENSEEAKKALSELHMAKYNLDNHPLVREYLNKYKEVRELYNQINQILFSEFNVNLCPKDK